MQGGDAVAYDSPAGSATAAGQCSGSCLRLCGVGDLLLLRPGFSARGLFPRRAVVVLKGSRVQW